MHRLHAFALACGHAAAAATLPRVTISSDDPSVFGISLVEELFLAAHAELGCGLREEGVKACVFNAVDAAFLDQGRKQALRERLAAAFTQWECDHQL